MQRCRTLDVGFFEVVLVFVSRDFEPAARDDAAFVEGIFVAMPQSDKLVVALAIREIERRDPAHGLERCLARPFEPFGKRLELAPARRTVKSADAHINRVDFAPAEQRQDLVADSLQREPPPDGIAVIMGHLDRAIVAEEVGCV
jgi:hypothetical protein